MASPCNNLTLVPIKVSKLVRYKNLDINDIFLTIESGSKLYSRRSTFGDLVLAFGTVTGSFTGSFSGSFKGKSSGSFSGSYFGSVVSKNTKSSGSFSGSYFGSVISKNTKSSGSFSGSYFGSVISKNTKASGSFSGSYFGSVTSKNTKASGSFSGNNSKLSGSFSGSYFGRVTSKNTKATGSFSGNNSKLSGSFSGSYFGRVVSKNSLITGSFRGVDNITNFKNTGKKVSFNGTASYAVSSSYAATASFISGPARLYHVYTRPTEVLGTPPANITLSVTKPSSATWYDFEIFLSQTAATNDGLQLQGNINFNTGVITGTSVSQQYDDGTSSPNILPSTGMGNVLQVWYGTVDNDSSLCRWEHTGLIPSTISSTNTISFTCGVTVINGSYDGNGRQVAGLKASYYF